MSYRFTDALTLILRQRRTPSAGGAAANELSVSVYGDIGSLFRLSSADTSSSATTPSSGGGSGMGSMVDTWSRPLSVSQRNIRLEDVFHAVSAQGRRRRMTSPSFRPLLLDIIQGDPSGWLKPPVDLVPPVLAAGGPLLHLPTARAGWRNIPNPSQGVVLTILMGHSVDIMEIFHWISQR